MSDAPPGTIWALGHYRAGREETIRQRVYETLALSIVAARRRQLIARQLVNVHETLTAGRNLAVVAGQLRDLASVIDGDG